MSGAIRASLPYSALVVRLIICLCVLRLQSDAQTSSPTFQSTTRVVLTDVAVTDSKGNPVHGLPQSAFRIFDGNQPQVITSFEEHAGAPAPTVLPVSASGVYSNDYLLHLPSVLNIVLVDIANMHITDQMVLNYQLAKFLNEQPKGQTLAIYLRAGSGCFLLQNFTSDRKLLLAALHKAIPRFPPLSPEYLSDFDTLSQIAISLDQLPGRKNLLWFSGGSTLFLMPASVPTQDSAVLRGLYDDLSRERIAVYPIDVRGLEPGDVGTRFSQHMAMNDAAQATGGQAFYNTNGLAEIADHLLNADTSFYTLTFSPQDLQFDNKWHKIRVALRGGSYHLSYRNGYFADGSLRGTDQPPKSRTRLLQNGEKLDFDTSGLPIIFQASILPASDPSLAHRNRPSAALTAPPAINGSIPFSIRYSLPMDALTVREVDGKHQVDVGIAAIALNRDGSPVDRKTERVTMALNESVFRAAPTLPITLDQQLNLPKDTKFLELGVWDAVNRRFGLIQIPLDAAPSSNSSK